LGEALAVLLYTWNRGYYQYHPASVEHLGDLEGLLRGHGDALAGFRKRELTSVSRADDQAVTRLFVGFEQLLGPVGAAKALHLLAPSYFPIWDRAIARAYVSELGPRGSNALRYLSFMRATAAQCRALAGVAGAPTDLLKALDEWNYVTFSRAGPPAR
jgi:hypothetical protein